MGKGLPEWGGGEEGGKRPAGNLSQPWKGLEEILILKKIETNPDQVDTEKLSGRSQEIKRGHTTKPRGALQGTLESSHQVFAVVCPLGREDLLPSRRKAKRRTTSSPYRHEFEFANVRGELC